MADISISLSNINNVKNVLIEGLGEFKVRKLGAGEALDLSEKTRRMNEIIEELDNLRLKIEDPENPTEADQALLKSTMDRNNELMKEVTAIQRFKLDMFKRCFDDGKNEVANQMIDSLTEVARDMLFDQIFNPKQVEKPEKIEDAEVKDA